MKHATKAALWSGLVFPGLGHLYLKRYTRAALLFGGTAWTLYFIVARTVETALAVTEKLRSGDVPPDLETITRLVSQQSAGSEQAMNIATLVLVALWLVGIVDAYRQGRAHDMADDSPQPGPT